MSSQTLKYCIFNLDRKFAFYTSLKQLITLKERLTPNSTFIPLIIMVLLCINLK